MAPPVTDMTADEILHDASAPTVVLDPETAGKTRIHPPPDVPKGADALVSVPVGMDWGLLSTIVGLMTFGVVMAYSASIYVALHNFNGDETHFLTRHLMHAGIAVFVLLLAIRTPYQLWRKVAYPLLFVSIGGLIAVLLWGKTTNNATRWLVIGGFPFQPAEFSKFAFVVYLAHSLTKKVSAEAVHRFSVGFVPHAMVWCVAFVLCMKEPDLGTGIVLAMLLFSMCYIAGTNMAYVVLAGIFGVVGLATYIINNPMRSRRLWAFLQPLDYRETTGFQLFNGKLAVATGGIFGNGLGLSRQKLGFVPEAHTDFVLSIIAEELGLIGVALVAIAFLFVILRGLRIALRARDEFGRLLASGITILLGTQAAVNFGVVMGTLPTKGLTLPFISHGGSSLIVLSLAAGVLINVGRGGNPDFELPLPSLPRLPSWLRRPEESGHLKQNTRVRPRTPSASAPAAREDA
jgi:cell division protein FtsW